jgi:hypothetical protein
MSRHRLAVKDPPIAMFDGPPLPPSLRTDVELAGADPSVPTAYGPRQGLPTAHDIPSI